MSEITNPEISRNISLVIGIPTYRRPQGLSRLLDSIQELMIPTNVAVSLIVADNEGNSEAVPRLLDNFRSRCKVIKALPPVAVKMKGISHTRNALLEVAFEDNSFDFLLMVDDDETVSPAWLQQMLKIQTELGAHVVGGKKNTVFESAPESWMTDCQIYTYSPPQGEGKVERLVSTDNLLIARSAYENFGKQKFDPNFALTGGGDTEYLHRLKLAGADFAFSEQAITEEHVPAYRMNWEWARQRAYRIGIGLARISRLHAAGAGEHLKFLVRLLLILVGSIGLMGVYVFNADKRKVYELFFIQQVGKLAGLAGKKVFPYDDKMEK